MSIKKSNLAWQSISLTSRSWETVIMKAKPPQPGFLCHRGAVPSHQGSTCIFVLHLFYKLCQNVYLSSFLSTIPSNKVIGTSPSKRKIKLILFSKWMCNWEGLILNPYWLCFCDFNSVFAAFVIIGMLNDLPQGALPAPWARMPLFDSLGDGLTLPTYEGLWLSWVLCVGNGAPHLLLTGVAQKFTFEELELQIAVASLFVYIIADIPFHTTSEITIRKWNSHIPLPEACHSRRHLQELNGLFYFVSYLPPSLIHRRTWHPGPRQDGYFKPLVCHLLGQRALQSYIPCLKILTPGFISL